MDRLFNVGAYVRLSVEAASYESDSVENQISMLSKFITMMPGWVEQKFYVDDGFSGATFQRPAFQEMIDDVRSGHINLVLVKDLSRFGRNYLEAGHYLEELLPSLGCRFVAFQDGIDTEDGENDIMPFLNAMNDYYVKNHSDRIRSIMAAKAKDGQKISGHAPYGYRRSDKDNTRLVVDEYSAGIVRRIFEMRAEGMGYRLIANVLNAEKILPPMRYYYTSEGRDDSTAPARVWRPGYVGKVLKNELYIGNAIQLEKIIVSYRDKREVSRPESERIRIDGAFPAIIYKELWDDVQAVNQSAAKRYEKKRAPVKQLFSDIAVCADCGAKMSYIADRTKSKNGTVYINYQCSKFQSTGGTACTRHNMSQLALGKLVFRRIMELTEEVTLDEKAVVKSLTERLVGDTKTSKAANKKEAAALRQRLHKLEVAISKLYEGRVTGQISERSFLTQMQSIETQRLDTEQRLSTLESSGQVAEEKMGDIRNWVRLIKENAAVKEINRDLLLAMIDKIEIGEGRMVNGTREKDIVIHYKFVGQM